VDAGLSGVLLGGNYVAGVALGKCVEYGYEFAAQVAQQVSAAAAPAAAAPAASKEKVAA
jgi:oxygen-dependent protoporphyrinogen oxidase